MRHWIGLSAALLIGGCAATILPTSAGAAVTADAPPLIAGRLSAVDGNVSIWRAEDNGNGGWDRAELNDVITVGTGLATDNGRAEVRVGPHAFRLGAGSTGGFSQLDFAAKTFGLERGVLNVRLAAGEPGEAVAVVVAGVQIGLAAPGRYRIDAIDDSPLKVSVFEGHGAVTFRGNTVTVSGGQALAMTQSNVGFASAISTALDAWALERDQRYAQSLAAARYVSPYMTGYEELDANGDWIADGTYGTVWVPRAVPVGWAPYRYGRWRWVAPWGWSWVDAAPWGYAPFHYGRWVTIGGRWCWWPGSYIARPVWAPALVGFVGSPGASFAVGVGGPVVGWYPLAPWHAYRPHYRAPTTYVTVINQTIIHRPPHGVPHDVNQRPGSTWVPQQRFQEPVVKVRIPAQTEKVADLQPMAPPPQPKRSASIAAEPHASARPMPPQPRARPAPDVVRPAPKFTAAAPQPLPGTDTSLSQPAPIRRVEPRPLPPAGPLPEREAPRPKPHQPAEIVPPYQQLQKPFPAEPARTPPAAPPTIRQPSSAGVAPSAKAPVAPSAPVHRSPVVESAPKDAPAAAAQPAPSAKQDAPDVRAPKPDIPRPKTSAMER
jgi:hypothetical protein